MRGRMVPGEVMSASFGRECFWRENLRCAHLGTVGFQSLGILGEDV